MSRNTINAIFWLLAFTASNVWAGAQQYEPLSASVKSQLSKAVADSAVKSAAFAESPSVQAWLAEMSRRLDPEMVLGLIEVESGFRKYAVSSATAQGYMQIMPFWTKLIGAPDHNLFHLRTNLRYGVTILRHYIDIEHGDLFRALGRYNGSLGQPEYPSAVYAAWRKKFTYGIPPASARSTRQAQSNSLRQGG
jgi:soluble lytic murein transglycosylase-like protein